MFSLQHAHAFDPAAQVTDRLTQNDLDQVAEALTPLLVGLLRTRPEQTVTLRITCSPIDMNDESKGQIMRWAIKIDGVEATAEQDQTVKDFLQAASKKLGLV